MIDKAAEFFLAHLSNPAVQNTIDAKTAENMFGALANIIYNAKDEQIGNFINLPDKILLALSSKSFSSIKTFSTKAVTIHVISSPGNESLTIGDSVNETSSEFQYPGIESLSSTKSVTFGFKSWTLSLLPSSDQTETLSNFISLDIFSNKNAIEVKDLQTPIKIIQYIQTSLLPDDVSGLKLGYYDEATKSLKYDGCTVLSIEPFNSTHSKVTSAVTHLTSFVMTKISIGTDEKFSWEKVRIVYPIIGIGLLALIATITIIASRPTAKINSATQNSGSVENQYQSNPKTSTVKTEKSYLESLKYHHNLVSLFFDNNLASKPVRFAIYLARWYAIMLISTLIFHGRNIEDFEIGATIWVGIISFICGFILTKLLEFAASNRGGSNVRKLSVAVLLALYMAGSIAGVLVLSSDNSYGFNDAVFYSFWIMLAWDVGINQPVYTLAMKTLKK